VDGFLIFFGSFFIDSRKLLGTGAFRIWGGQPKLVSEPQLGKFVKNIDFLGRIITKNWEDNPKYRKIADSPFEFGPQKFLFGLWVGHPCLMIFEKLNIPYPIKLTFRDRNIFGVHKSVWYQPRLPRYS
jgi:hypothetical protein